MPSPQDPSVPSPQGQEGEVVRLRRTFRVAVIAAAVGASIGAAVIMTVVGAVVSVIDRPASEASKTEKTKAALQQKNTPQEQKGTPQAQASAQPSAAPPTPRRVEESPAPKEATCKDQTWPYLDGKCLTPADDRAPPPADVATTGPAAAPPVAAQSPATPAASALAPAPAQASASPASGPSPAIAQTSATARPETTGSAVQSPQPAQPAMGVATTGVAPSDTPDFDKKSRKKAEDSRAAQQKRARQDDKGADRRLATRPDRDSPERNSSRDAAAQSSRFWSTRAAEPDDEEVTPRTRTLVIVPPRSRAEAVSEDVVTTRKQRRSARSRLEAEPRVEERSDDGGRDFFGGLFGGQRD
ncbi:MAG: hypothetical protein QOK01_2133 [Alphaproteobacteria bacterium]|jgi:hypothetical protein|nr:hypothetical protein [Alphaproteobacteria bacterium]